jgi:hypothetical protein
MISPDLLPRKSWEEFPPELTSRLDARVKRLGYLGEFFKCAAHQPGALAAFIDFTEEGKGSLPPRIVEIVALTCAGWMGNAYERNQHERLSVRLGFGRDWVAAVNARDPEAQKALPLEEQRVQRLVLEILDSKGKSPGAQALFRDMAAERGPEQATAVLMVIGRYLVHAIVVNTLDLAPPVASIFEDGFTG